MSNDFLANKIALYNELNWVNRPSNIESPEPGDEEAVEIIRKLYPEISDWSDYGIYIAWGQFCQDVRMITWMSPDSERDPLFLGYLHHKAHKTEEYNWGSEGQAEAAAKKLGLIE